MIRSVTAHERGVPGEPAWSWIDLALAGPALFVMGAVLQIGIVWLPSVIWDCDTQYPGLLAESQLGNLKNGVKSYYVSYGALPQSLQDLVDTPDGFKIVEEVPQDPWGNAYAYHVEGAYFALGSAGADEAFGTDDDLVVTGRWQARTVEVAP